MSLALYWFRLRFLIINIFLTGSRLLLMKVIIVQVHEKLCSPFMRLLLML